VLFDGLELDQWRRDKVVGVDAFFGMEDERKARGMAKHEMRDGPKVGRRQNET
jgi:hypothetical protein